MKQSKPLYILLILFVLSGVILFLSKNVNMKSIFSSNDRYVNEKLGFGIEYPKSLMVEGEEYDVQSEYKEYQRKCKSGEIDGCGGGRPQDYQVKFLDENKEPIFRVDIYKGSWTKDYGGVEQNGFTYVVEGIQKPGEYDLDTGKINNKINQNTIDQIESSLTFTQPQIFK